MTAVTPDLDRLAIDTIRTLSIDGVQQANSGHPGAPMGAAPMAYVVWTRFLKHAPAHPDWPDRDRFVLSAGHASMLLYSLLHLTGYDVTMDDLKTFRQWGSRTPGHPEHGLTPGVEATTGPLGQGITNAVGMAIAERRWRRVQPATATPSSTTAPTSSPATATSRRASPRRRARWPGTFGWASSSSCTTTTASSSTARRRWPGRGSPRALRCLRLAHPAGRRRQRRRGHRARDRGRRRRRPAVAHRGAHPHRLRQPEQAGLAEGARRAARSRRGAPDQGGLRLGPGQDVLRARRRAGPLPRGAFADGRAGRPDWDERSPPTPTPTPTLAAEFRRRVAGRLADGWDADLKTYAAGEEVATRNASQDAIQALAARVPELFGGAADLSESNLTDVKGEPNFSADEPGRNLRFGVREHAMGGIANGIAYHGGFIPYDATFLTFSDYMRGSVRLSALAGLHVIHVWTHDSVGLGEDGPTHQPVEHYAALRAIPNLWFVRPGDANETAAAWAMAVERGDGPVALALTRQKLPTLAGTAERAREGVRRGGYVLRDAAGDGDAGPHPHRDRVGAAAGVRRRGAARGRRHPRPGRVPPLLGDVRPAGPGVSRLGAAAVGPQAGQRRDRRVARLGALGRRRGRDHRARPLRRVRAGRHDLRALRVHRRPRRRRRPAGRPRGPPRTHPDRRRRALRPHGRPPDPGRASPASTARTPRTPATAERPVHSRAPRPQLSN